MIRTHYLFLRDCSKELHREIDEKGEIQTLVTPAITLGHPENLHDVPLNSLLDKENVRELSKWLSLSCKYDASAPPSNPEEIEHTLGVIATALQLVKPTTDFCEFRLQCESDRGVTQVSIRTKILSALQTQYPYLKYQQHHTISPQDVHRAVGVLPLLSKARGLNLGGSWNHVYGSIHRAVMFFCQGYSAQMGELQQVLWAAGLDCLFASKLKKSKRGALEIARRLQKLWGPNFNPYKADTVQVPTHQKGRPAFCLSHIAKDIFVLRNAFMHGLPIPNPAWLSNPSCLEAGYAYQTLECTEILLRITLLKLLEDQNWFDIFLNPAKLDAHF